MKYYNPDIGKLVYLRNSGPTLRAVERRNDPYLAPDISNKVRILPGDWDIYPLPVVHRYDGLVGQYIAGNRTL